MSLQINLKEFVKPDLSRRIGAGEDASVIRDKIKNNLESSEYFKKYNLHKTRQAAKSVPLKEQLYNAKAFCKIKTAEISMYLTSETRTKFFSQLDYLMDPDNWEDDDKPISEESFTTLLRMLISFKPARRPGLGATSEGNIIAAWTNGKNRLTIECLGADKVRWILGRQIEEDRESAAGETKLIRLSNALAPYNPNIWFNNES